MSANEIEIRLNGVAHSLPEGTTVSELVAQLKLVPEQVAVEVNETIVRRKQHAETKLAAGDNVELVTLVGGG